MNRILPLAIAMLLLTGIRAMAEPGDATRGERRYRACVACHSLEPNRNMTGPSLAEIWNRKSGSLPSFPRYSPALKSAGIIWTDDTLDEWIKDPQHFIPGNTMTFPGMKDARQRADLLAFLKDATRPGHAPKTAQGGSQMGGMMMGGGGARQRRARRTHVPCLRRLPLARAQPQHDRPPVSRKSGIGRRDRCRASRVTRPRSSRPTSSGPTTRSTNGSRTRSTSFRETP